MPIITDDHGRMTAIVFTRGRAPKLCIFCLKVGTLRESTRLCDWPLANARTCAAPMCEGHARPVGVNRDHCPDHAARR